MAVPVIVIVNVDEPGILEAELVNVAAALTRQVQEHFAPNWNASASVRAATATTPPLPGEWRAELRKVPTIDGALGFHDRQPDGTPVLYVFPELCAQDKSSWSSCLSHEVLEALADPGLNAAVQDKSGKFWAVEVCDQVEQDTYRIDGIEVSNFNLRANFAPTGAPGEKFDHLGLQKIAGEVRPGGYSQWFDPTKGWQQTSPASLYRRVLGALGFSRGARRGAGGRS